MDAFRTGYQGNYCGPAASSVETSWSIRCYRLARARRKQPIFKCDGANMLARLKGGLNPWVTVCLRKRTEEVGTTGKIEEISEAEIILGKFWRVVWNFVTFSLFYFVVWLIKYDNIRRGKMSSFLKLRRKDNGRKNKNWQESFWKLSSFIFKNGVV